MAIDERHKRKVLRRVLPGLPADDAEALIAHAYPVRYRAGTVIYHADHPTFAWYLVGEGLLEICIVCRHKALSRTCALLGPGDTFGEERWYEPRAGGICSTRVRALEDSLICLIKTHDLWRLVRERPGLIEPLLNLLARKLKTLEHELSQSSYGSVEQRLLSLFQRLARCYGTRRTEEGLQLGRTISQGEVAQLLGVSRRTVSVHMRRLAQEGRIRYRGGRLWLPDPERKTRHAG